MLTETDRNWYALYVRSRHEFIAQDELRRKEIDAFLPTVKKCRHWRDRKKCVEFPLFPGYLFVRIAARPDEYRNVLRTRGVVHILSSESGCPTAVSPEEVSALKLMIESGQPLDIYPNLREGARVKVRGGPLAGAEGIIGNKSEQYEFVVNIELLGRSIGVKMYADHIESA